MAIILINAAQEEELRIAILDENNRIRDLIFEHPEKEEKIHNIYKGVVTGVETSLNAVFVNFGAEKHGFLPIKDISPLSIYQNLAHERREDRRNLAHEEVVNVVPEESLPPEAGVSEQIPALEVASADAVERSRYSAVKIEDIKAGQELIVQVDKEERGNKGAALTTHISLAGRYLVLMPESAQAGGISRRVEGDDRNLLKEALAQLSIPVDMAVIGRTSAVNKLPEELQWDLDMLVEQWHAIKEASVKRKAPFLIFQESGIVNRIIRDYLSQDIEQIIVDDPQLYEKLKEYIQFIRPKFLEKLVLYAEKIPLFSRYHIENQIDNVYQSSVRLASGGSIVINRTEALVSIDVNSARATRGSGIEETALQINLEAADEIARQLRLRDIGGLIVIDFIDMASMQHQKEVEIKLKNALRGDRARVQIGRISRFGLLEMSRQRLKSSLSEETQVICPRCKGEGHVRSVQSVALSILRVIEEDAVKGQVSKIHLQVPVDMAAFFLNEKRKKLVDIEEKNHVKIIVLPNLNLHSPHYHIKREKSSGETEGGKVAKSHESLESYEEINIPKAGSGKKFTRHSKPAVEFTVSRPAPTPQPQEAPGLLKRLFASVFGSSEAKSKNDRSSGSYRQRSGQKTKFNFSQPRKGHEGEPGRKQGRGGRKYYRDNNKGRGRKPSGGDATKQ